jgi:hypothetical protein
MGGHGRIFNLGKRSFPFNVWITVSLNEYNSIAQNAIGTQFNFQPEVIQDITCFETEPDKPKKRKSSRKKKEVEE